MHGFVIGEHVWRFVDFAAKQDLKGTFTYNREKNLAFAINLNLFLNL